MECGAFWVKQKKKSQTKIRAQKIKQRTKLFFTVHPPLTITATNCSDCLIKCSVEKKKKKTKQMME